MPFQSTHPLRGATRIDEYHTAQIVISIHAPLAGCDPTCTEIGWEAYISIHAPLAGCDADDRARLYDGGHFNPRTPCGVRPIAPAVEIERKIISIHAPLAGCDSISCADQRLAPPTKGGLTKK